MSIPIPFQEFVEDIANQPLLPEIASELQDLDHLLKTASNNQQTVQSTMALLQTAQASLEKLSDAHS